MHYYPHNISDFDAATRHLTRVERSVYRDAIERYYDTEEALTIDTNALEKRLLCVSDEEKAALKAILVEFFIHTDAGYCHARCELEIEKYRSNTSAKARAGKASAEARKKTPSKKKSTLNTRSTHVQHMSNTRSTHEQQTNNQEPITNNQEPITNNKINNKTIVAYTDFELFWDIYPRRTDKTKAKAAWLRLKPDDSLLTKISSNIAARISAGEWAEGRMNFIPHPTTYLNNRRWEDEVMNYGQPTLKTKEQLISEQTDRNLKEFLAEGKHHDARRTDTSDENFTDNVFEGDFERTGEDMAIKF